jgi:hypothetical protein
VQQRCSGFGQRDTRGVQQLPCLALGEAQVRLADLSQLTGQAQPVQPQREIVPGDQDRVAAGRASSPTTLSVSVRTLRSGAAVGGSVSLVVPEA